MRPLILAIFLLQPVAAPAGPDGEGVTADADAPAEAGRATVGPRDALKAGMEAREAGRWGEAIRHFQAALEGAPTWGLAHLELAQALLHTGGDPGEIGQHLERVRLLDPDNPRLHYLTGLLMEEMRQPAQAAAAYERAVELRGSLFDARVRLGRLLLAEGRAAEAAEHLEAALQRHGADLAARANLARAYEDQGDLARAEGELQRIAALFPENVFHLHRLARFYERHGQTTKAEDVLRRADAVQPREDRKLRPLPKSRR